MNEQFNEMFKNFFDLQQKTISSLTTDFKAPMEYSKNYEEMINNSIQFHKAAITYHNSIVEMMEITKNSMNLFNPIQK